MFGFCFFWQVKHLAMNSSISFFMFLHKKFLWWSLYIFIVPGCNVNFKPCASLRILSLRLFYCGTQILLQNQIPPCTPTINLACSYQLTQFIYLRIDLLHFNYLSYQLWHNAYIHLYHNVTLELQLPLYQFFQGFPFTDHHTHIVSLFFSSVHQPPHFPY